MYIDDILVSSTTAEEHETRLRALFRRLNDHGLVVNPQKSILGANAVQFLGFQVDAAGIRPLDSKVTAVQNFPKPATYMALSEFLGMTNYYHRFIRDCSKIARPLYDILAAGSRAATPSTRAIPGADWTLAAAGAFHALKTALAKAASLAFPAHDLKTRLVTDASDRAAGAVLEQYVDDAWHPVSFYSKAFSTAETKYSTYDRELLAIKLALNHIRHIVEGIPGNLFHVATDHKPLTTGKNFAPGDRSASQLNRVTRTWQLISEFTSATSPEPTTWPPTPSAATLSSPLTRPTS